MHEVEMVVDAKAELGEGPCWDEVEGVLYFVDILGERVHIYDPTTKSTHSIQLEQMVGAVVPRESGGLVLAMQNGFYLLDPKTEQVNFIGDPESHLVDNRFNDGKCDAQGRFWAGTMGTDRNGALYCLDEDQTIHKKVDGISTSNGIAWSPDQRYMYFIDTPTFKVVQYDFNKESGEIENPIDVIYVPERIGLPDGMTIDEEGMLWIAHFDGGGVSRWNPETGEQLDFIPIPAVNVTSCTFGGTDQKDLYITTARTGTSDEDLENFPYAGGVFRVKMNFQGAVNHPYKG